MLRELPRFGQGFYKEPVAETAYEVAAAPQCPHKKHNKYRPRSAHEWEICSVRKVVERRFAAKEMGGGWLRVGCREEGITFHLVGEERQGVISENLKNSKEPARLLLPHCDGIICFTVRYCQEKYRKCLECGVEGCVSLCIRDYACLDWLVFAPCVFLHAIVSLIKKTK